MSETELKFAKRAIAQIALMGGEHTQQLLAYIKLFSAPENPLSLEQTYEILLTVADFWATYPAQAWQIAVNKLLAQHRSGSLKTPLANHDVLIDEMEQVAQFTDHDTPPPPNIAPKSPDPPKRNKRTPEQEAIANQQLAQMYARLNRCTKP